MTDDRHLPVQHANAPGLGLVPQKVVDLVVAVNECGAFLAVSVVILEELQHLVRTRNAADSSPSILVTAVLHASAMVVNMRTGRL